MLQSLRIQNFALIDQVELNFKKGYTVITGETGSGKSILLSALNLILGERADFSVIGTNSDKSIVEAEFDLKGFSMNHFFNENDLDYEEITLIRREINSNGKSRAFINDTPVSLNVLKDLTENLVNIHSQYNTLELKSRSYQLGIVDTLGELITKRNEFTAKFKHFQQLDKNLIALKLELSHALQQQDYTKFQLQEIDELNLDQTDFEKFEIELSKSEKGEDISNALQSIISCIDDEGQVVDRLRLLKSSLEKVKNFDSTVDELASRINSVLIELSDVSNDAQKAFDGVEMNPERLVQLTAALNQFNHVLRKHNLRNQSELLLYKNELENAVLNSEELQNQILKMTSELEHLNSELTAMADKLHEDRVQAIQPISAEMQAILEELKLPHTKLDFQLVKRTEFNSTGLTDISLLFSANLGVETVPIERAASGGELSRVMLALQKLISEKKLLPTVLFDEIDTGVSGDVAQKIGTLLQKMGTHFQLFAISHLPQVAAKASNHLRVEKEVVNNKTSTKVAVLNDAERVEEIARMMSGEKITSAAIETAKALMQ